MPCFDLEHFRSAVAGVGHLDDVMVDRAIVSLDVAKTFEVVGGLCHITLRVEKASVLRLCKASSSPRAHTHKAPFYTV
ncbi:hypothetical protein EMIT051CA3_140004 [Pseudomonas chlororaphis]